MFKKTNIIILLFVFVFSVLCLLIFAEEYKQCDWEKDGVKWKMTKDEIIKIYPGTKGYRRFLHSPFCFYMSYRAQIRFVLEYPTNDDRHLLGQINYIIIYETDSTEKMIAEYFKLQDKLEEKYGEPDRFGTLYYEKDMKKDQKLWPEYLKKGKIHFDSRWKFTDNDYVIHHSLINGFGSIRHEIVFYNRIYYESD